MTMQKHHTTHMHSNEQDRTKLPQTYPNTLLNQKTPRKLNTSLEKTRIASPAPSWYLTHVQKGEEKD